MLENNEYETLQLKVTDFYAPLIRKELLEAKRAEKDLMEYIRFLTLKYKNN